MYHMVILKGQRDGLLIWSLQNMKLHNVNTSWKYCEVLVSTLGQQRSLALCRAIVRCIVYTVSFWNVWFPGLIYGWMCQPRIWFDSQNEKPSCIPVIVNDVWWNASQMIHVYCYMIHISWCFTMRNGTVHICIYVAVAAFMNCSMVWYVWIYLNLDMVLFVYQMYSYVSI